MIRSRRPIRMETGDTFGGTVPLILLHQATREPARAPVWPWVLGLVLLAAVGAWAGLSPGLGDMLADVRGVFDRIG